MKKIFLNDEERVKIIKIIIYAILITAAMSDILRISGTVLTFFRISLPIAIVIIALYPHWFLRFAGMIVGILGLTFLQYLLFYKVLYPEIELIQSRILFYLFLYICNFLIFFLVKIIQINSDKSFEKTFANFIIILGLSLLAVNVVYKLFPHFFGSLSVDNPNNYGCYIAALAPFLLVKSQVKKDRLTIIMFILTCAVLIINDSKAALFGVVVQIGIFLCLALKTDTKAKLICFRGGIVVLGIALLVVVLVIDPSLNGYSMRGTILEPVKRILGNDPYPIYSTSITFRTNTTLYALWTIIRTGCIGLGIGNTGILLKQQFPDLNPEYLQALNSPALSLHNAWLELLLDVGIVVLILYIAVMVYALKLFFTKKQLTQLEKIRCIYIISFPIWVISTSGIYTLYYLMIIMAFLLFAQNKEKIF